MILFQAFHVYGVDTYHKNGKEVKRNSFVTKAKSFSEWSHVWLAHSQKKKKEEKLSKLLSLQA